MNLFEKKYSLFELKVIGLERGNGTCQYYICQKYNDYYKEVLTGMKIPTNEIHSSESLVEWVLPPAAYMVLDRTGYNSKTYYYTLTKKEILEKYNLINYINFFLEHDEELMKEELSNRGLFEESQIYKKRVKNKNTNA